MIPNVIHQIYLSGDLPAPLQGNVDSLKALNPGWEHRLWDAATAETYIRSGYGEGALGTYRKIDCRYGAARADFLRHLIIYREGGVYCDIKSGFSRPLDAVVRPDDKYVLAQWRNGPGEPNEGMGLHHDLAHIPGGEFVTYFIIAEPRHPFSKATIDQITDNVEGYRPWSSVGRNGVLRTTGPIAYTRAVWPIVDQHPHRVATEAELGAYPSIDYDHFAVFPNHYSLQTAPVARLGSAGEMLSKFFVMLRRLKSKPSE